MLEICAIASGSNGNCYYVGNEKDAVLIDAGISAKQIVQRMKDRNWNPLKIKASFYYPRTQRSYVGSPRFW
jgi:glyoxylase-like metal-dependent hydrolase (beta-lactamase superfamily II)